MAPISWGTSCREGEKLSLLQFKEGLHGPSGRLKTWNASTYYCEWEGILCHRDTGHVVHLDLRYPRGYYGDFGLGRYASDDVLTPANRHDVLLPLFNLTMLEHLDLSYNDFIGVGVPHQFHMLNKLQYLNLSNAGFVGIIPRELGNMSRLRCLDLSTEYYISDSSQLRTCRCG
ncbi:receptor-like protein EIX2 [Cryptomeria japonica]|uniref:receptor-like protein EIX2 n=1 Tax=Cryptomeria japonica TaxID=3369 RepID=UPI0027DA6C0C|nr:receptor-like protein EIX2 [Cryptomeria japonica]